MEKKYLLCWCHSLRVIFLLKENLLGLGRHMSQIVLFFAPTTFKKTLAAYAKIKIKNIFKNRHFSLILSVPGFIDLTSFLNSQKIFDRRRQCSFFERVEKCLKILLVLLQGSTTNPNGGQQTLWPSLQKQGEELSFLNLPCV